MNYIYLFSYFIVYFKLFVIGISFYQPLLFLVFVYYLFLIGFNSYQNSSYQKSYKQSWIKIQFYNQLRQIMQSIPTKPYFIEVYNQEDKSFRNKFKFVLSAKTVLELKTSIKQKLIGKKQLQDHSQIIMTDNDDYQLASDDQVNDVIADGKVKIYKKKKNAGSIVNVPQPNPIMLPTLNSNPSVGSNNNIVVQNIPVLQSNHSKDNDLVVKSSLLNLSNLKFPIIDQSTKHVIKARCPQIRKSVIEIPVQSFAINSYLELSSFIVETLGLQKNLKAIIYNKYGQPYLYNLDLLCLTLPKIDFSQDIWVIFTPSESTTDNLPVDPKQSITNLSHITISNGLQKYNLEVDFNNTLYSLKYKIFEILKFHPLNQILKFGGKALINEVQTLKSYGLIEGSIIQVTFKLTGNLVPSTFADKFYYKDIKHTRQQTEQGVNELRSTLLTMAAHLADDDKLRFTTFIRGLSENMTLTFGLKCLLNNNFVSQAHRIAIQEGFLVQISQYIKHSTPALNTMQHKQLFTKFRDFIGFVLEGALKIIVNEQLRKQSQIIQVQRNCQFTMIPIRQPTFIRLDTKRIVVVDKQAFLQQIKKGFTYPLLQKPSAENVFLPKQFNQYYYQFLMNQIDNQGTNTIFWHNFKEQHPKIIVPPFGVVDLYRCKLQNYPELKVHKPLQIKNKSSVYLLLKNKEDKYRVFVSKNKDIARPYNVFNVFNGNQEAVNFDLMSANVQSQNVEEVIDMSNLKPVITRQPKEAIAILFDISGSMGQSFFNEPDLKRIGAVKSFFEAFAFRTIAYNFQHVVSLFFFDHTIENQCDFTEAIYDFNRLIAKAAPKGSTLMYDAIVKAIISLNNFKKRYPDCLLRIVALTDGEDTGSINSIEVTTELLIKHNIVIDSFAVGANCEGLKIISKASGGRCYLTRNLQDSLKLFEQQTVLSVRARKSDQIFEKLTIEQRVSVAKIQPFDLPNSVHEFKMPQIKGGISAKQMIQKMKGSEQSKKISGNNSLKRISKQIQNYSDNPHPFVAIFPCSNINIWKILLLGPKQTPYQNGLFLLYAQFPGDYPFKAPEVRFITPIYHCNMNSQGRICHSVFDRNYSPAITFRQIVDCVYGLILTPEPEDPLDNVIASFFLSDYKTYQSNAIKHTKQKASLSTQYIVEQLFGKIANDSERKEKEKEIDQWIKLAKSCN